MTARFHVGDSREVVESLPDGSVDLVATSPPFLALRSYLPADHPDKHKEIGSEPTPAEFLDTLLDLTELWGRKLAPHGSIFVELGDTYSGSGGGGGVREGQPGFGGTAARQREGNAAHWRQKNQQKDAWPLAKSLCGIPSLYANSLAYGRNLLNPEHVIEPWRIRNLIAWVRPNPPVGALGDKVRPATSYATWACRSNKRWFDLDAVRAPATYGVVDATRQACAPYEAPGQTPNMAAHPAANGGGRINSNPAGAPPLDWWEISPGGFDGSHYAVFPEELLRIPIEASCPRRVCVTCGVPSRRTVDAQRAGVPDDEGRDEGANVARIGMALPPERGWEYDRTTTGWSTCGCPGTDGIRLDGYHTGSGWRPGLVLDPFGGSGTTGVVATGRGRDCILVDLDERNLDLARQRIGMFLEDAS